MFLQVFPLGPLPSSQKRLLQIHRQLSLKVTSRNLPSQSWSRHPRLWSNYLIIKPLNDSTCTLRHDRDAGVYIITPIIPEGVITLRVGYMDFLGAYKRVDEIDFTVVAEQPKQE